MTIGLICSAIILHFLCDWVIQDRDVAKTKKTNVIALTKHLLYNIVPFSIILFTILVMLYNTNLLNTLFIVLSNLILHGLLDWFLPSGENERDLINYTALDQILHLVILFILINLLF